MNNLPLTTKLGLAFIMVFGIGSIAMLFTGNKHQEAPVASIAAPKKIVKATPVVKPALAPVIASHPVVVSPVASASTIQPMSASAPTSSLATTPVVTAPNTASVPVQITVKVVTENGQHSAVIEQSVQKITSKSQPLVSKPTTVVSKKHITPKIVRAQKVAPQATVAAPAKPVATVPATTSETKPTTAAPDFLYKPGVIRVIPDTTHATAPVVKADPKPETKPELPRVSGTPTPIIAKDYAVWVKVDSMRTVQVKKGESIDGLGVYQGLVEGQPKFSGKVVPINN